MKEEIASMDLVALVQELQALEGARIDKFYQRDNELILHAYKPGDQKYRLFMTDGKAFLTKFKREMPDKPPSFCMYLRKQLSGREIQEIKQYEFDRILEIHTEEHILICELFRNGNFILVDNTLEIKNAMTFGDASGGREIQQGEEYEYPAADQAGIREDELFEENADDKIVVVLAAEVGLGGSWAEEMCARAEIDKNTPAGELTDEQRDMIIETVNEAFHTLRNGPLDPAVYYQVDEDGELPVAATPVPFVTYSEESDKTREFDSFSRALDIYFTEKEKAEYVREKTKAYREEKEKLERRLDQQERKVEGMKTAITENKEKGDLIYENYSVVEDVIDTVHAAQKQYGNAEIEERLNSEQAKGIPEAEAIERLDLGQQEVVLDLGDEVRIDLTKDVERNAEYYYERSKKSKEKLAGVRKALKETERELEELEKEDVDVEDAFKDKEQKQAEKQWYEKFRWFYSSDGFLVIGGRDTTSNDMLVKKYMEDDDIYVHAEFTGAPSVVIKAGGEDVPESTLEEAGQFAVTFARSWKAGVTAEDAYWVHPDQVTQEPESGEYLPKGSFVIRGDREYMRNLPVKGAIGAYERDDGVVAMGGPVDAVKKQCDHYVVIEQGDTKPSDIAKTIQSHLHEQTGEDFDLDRIIRALPPGKSTIVEKQ